MEKQCYFCTNNIKEISHKNPELLRRFLDNQSRILAKRETGLCSRHQRKLSRTIKRARILALLPFVSR